MDAPRWLRLSGALACATSWSGFREAAALRAERHESTGVLPAVTKREWEAGATSSSAGIDGQSGWKKSLAAGAAIGALASGGGVEAFHVRPHAGAAGVRGKDGQFPGGGAVGSIFEEQRLFMTYPNQKNDGYMSDQVDLSQNIKKLQFLELAPTTQPHGQAAGAAVGYLPSGGGIKAFRVPPNAGAAGVRGKATRNSWLSSGQFPGGGAVATIYEKQPNSMTYPNQKNHDYVSDQVNLSQTFKKLQFLESAPTTQPRGQARLRIGPKLGNGAYAAVYVGSYYPEDNQQEIVPVAVKRIPKKEETERMVKREMRMMYELEQSRDLDDSVWPFLRLYSFEEYDQESHLDAVMELADGDLENMVMKKTFDEVNFVDRTRIFFDLVHALTVMNLKGFLHRDVKPQNVFLKNVTAADGIQEYRVKLGDFGLSCAVAGDIDILRLNDWERTQPAGSPLYMSREQFMPEYAEMLTGKAELGLKCDVFSLGMILYRLVFLGRGPLDYWKYAIPRSEEFPQGSFDKKGWAEGFDLQADPNFRYARASTKALGSGGDVNNILTAALDMMEVMMDQDVYARPLPEDVYKQGFVKLGDALRGAEKNIGSVDMINKLVARRIGDILWSASQDPVYIEQMGKSVS